MKKLALIALAALASLPATLSAQTATGTLNVTATVNGSISMVFNTDPSGITLTGAGTNAATMAFGNVSAYGALGAGISRVVGATNFTVSSPFDVNVAKTNVVSANYTLKAQLSTADPNNTWAVGGTTVTSGAAATLTTTGAYASNNSMALALTIPFSTANNTSISNSVAFTATAN
ncbi:MAG: hypothetical protein JOZ43_00190 [Acidobacteriales bacterium]|nr:hypothetical protein [Terriglobales bacterium]